MPIVNTNRMSALERKEKQNSLHSRLQDRVGGWTATQSGLRAGTVQVVSSGGGERIRVSSKLMLSGTTLAEALDNSEVDVTVANGTKFLAGDTIRIESEHMYVSRVETNILYVVRGADGTANVAHITGLDIYKVNPKTPTRYSELSSETVTFVKDGSSFNYPKQMQFIPSANLDFGTALVFANEGLVDYDDDQYNVLFILKDMQTFNVADVATNQSLQVSAESKTATGFTPTANIYVGSVLTNTIVTSFDDSGAADGTGGSTLPNPVYSTAKTAYDAFDDQSTAGVTSISVTYTLTYSAVKGSGEFTTQGYIRVGTSDTSNAFRSENYADTAFSDFRDAGFGDGTVTKTASFTIGSFTDATCDYNNDPTIAHDDDNGAIRVGMKVSGTGIPDNAYVDSVIDDEEFELSASTTGGSKTNQTLTFTGLASPARVVLTITNYTELGGSTATLSAAITSITYTTSSGTTRSLTGAGKADAIVIAR